MIDKDIREVIQLLRKKLQDNPRILKSIKEDAATQKELVKLQYEEQSRQLEPIIYK